MLIQSSVVIMILGWDFPFVYPNLEWTLTCLSFINKDWLHNFKSLECGYEFDDFAFWLLRNELNGSGFMTKDFVTLCTTSVSSHK